MSGNVIRPSTDALGRTTGKTIEVGDNKIAEEKISYVKFGDHATNMPSNVRFATNGVFKESMQYKYDSMGNIVEISENGRSACRYEYDTLGRLTREDTLVQSIIGIGSDVTKRILDREQIVVLIVGVGCYVVLCIGCGQSVAEGIVDVILKKY